MKSASHPRKSVLSSGDAGYTSLASPYGVVWIATWVGGVCGIEIGGDELQFVVSVEQSTGQPLDYRPDLLIDVVAQLSEYFAGVRTVFTVPICWPEIGLFQRTVLEKVCEVPYGTVMSYGDIARAIGRPRAARAVGTAVATSPISIVVPCHRIIRSDGSPGEYASRTRGRHGQILKRRLLAHEGYTPW
ncbi:MAG: methylated-DNA--[protein]-cysteine S-methyltransferase [Chloroflexota bacterium]